MGFCIMALGKGFNGGYMNKYGWGLDRISVEITLMYTKRTSPLERRKIEKSIIFINTLYLALTQRLGTDLTLKGLNFIISRADKLLITNLTHSASLV